MAKTKDKPLKIEDTPDYQRLITMPWYTEYRQAMTEQGFDFIAKLTATEPKHWLFIPDWWRAKGGFSVWSDRNAEWIRKYLLKELGSVRTSEQ